MGAASEVEMLQARVQFMRESLGKSQSATESMISILGFLDHRLSTLECAMRPTQIEVIFSLSSANGMRQAAQDLMQHLAQTAKETFGDFEDAVATDGVWVEVRNHLIWLRSGGVGDLVGIFGGMHPGPDV